MCNLGSWQLLICIFPGQMNCTKTGTPKLAFLCVFNHCTNQVNLIGSLIGSMLASSAVDRGFEPWSGQTKDYEIDIYCFSAKHSAFKRMSKDWLAGNPDNVSELGDMSIRGLLFQWTSTLKIQLSVFF